jgi:hypothetical protein
MTGVAKRRIDYNDGTQLLVGNATANETSDGFHTIAELYQHRLLLTAALFLSWKLIDGEWSDEPFSPHKSMLHSDGEVPFGGGWFIVVAQLPTGQISYHYELKDWDLFNIPERARAAEFDGHTAQDVADRLESFLKPDSPGSL